VAQRQKLTRVLIGAGVLLLVSIVAVWQFAGRSGNAQIETWLAKQVVGIITSYTNTEIRFTELDYQAPFTVVVAEPALSADGVDLFTAERLTLTLAELPTPGSPVAIQNIDLIKPVLTFQQAEDGRFRGWSQFVNPNATKQPDAIPTEYRLSEVLELRNVNIVDAQFVFAPHEQDPMTLRDLTTHLKIDPQPDEPGWYSLSCNVDRAPILTLDLASRVNLDTSHLSLNSLSMALRLGEDTYDSLPPALQTILRQHEAKGQLTITASGEIPFADWSDGSMTVKLELNDALVASGEYVLPVESVVVDTVLADRKVKTDVLAAFLGGTLEVNANITAQNDFPTTADWKLRRLDLQKALRGNSNETPKFAGTMQSRGSVSVSLMRLPESLAGNGSVNVRDGRLVLLPGFTDLMNAMKIPFVNNEPGLADRAFVVFNIEPERITITESEVVSKVVAARATGNVYFDQRLDLDANGGPLEKAQKLLGGVGKLLGKISDKVVTYHIGGTMQQPRVTVKPIGKDISNITNSLPGLDRLRK
jgi:AsmA-like C-terminal region